jgi:hypothetical protein
VLAAWPFFLSFASAAEMYYADPIVLAYEINPRNSECLSSFVIIVNYTADRQKCTIGKN